MSDEALVHTLLSARAAIDAALALLTGQAAGCRHERRQDLRTFGEVEHWRCQDCGLEVKDGEPVPGPGGP